MAMAIGRRDLLGDRLQRVFFISWPLCDGRAARGAQAPPRSRRSIFAIPDLSVARREPELRPLDRVRRRRVVCVGGGGGDGGGCEPSTPFCERPLNQVMDMLLPPRAGEPLRAAQPVHIRA